MSDCSLRSEPTANLSSVIQGFVQRLQVDFAINNDFYLMWLTMCLEQSAIEEALTHMLTFSHIPNIIFLRLELIYKSYSC